MLKKEFDERNGQQGQVHGHKDRPRRGGGGHGRTDTAEGAKIGFEVGNQGRERAKERLGCRLSARDCGTQPGTAQDLERVDNERLPAKLD